ncbi:hypothetical protein WA026_021364 [Henosepilachna vigintioctopunctata]|uniref:Uncharacterized protein n=1 Tax=Henosepilachna vigintioctopunctata TaxID=420089 RepID=A0AAW1TXK8_9CUCU
MHNSFDKSPNITTQIPRLSIGEIFLPRNNFKQVFLNNSLQYSPNKVSPFLCKLPVMLKEFILDHISKKKK